jgi:UDP-2-acetamido-2-deoxy-ribo-hexuluronate aminotransferase
LITPYNANFTNHVYHQYTLRVIDANRNGLLRHLQNNGIACAIYYPVPLHMQKAYENDRYKVGDFPNTEQLSKEVISLPMHTEFTDDQLQFVTKTVLDFLKK